MNLGQIVGYLWTLLAFFFLLSVFLFPISLAYWRHREKAEQSATEAALRRCKADTTGNYRWDA